MNRLLAAIRPVTSPWCPSSAATRGDDNHLTMIESNAVCLLWAPLMVERSRAAGNWQDVSRNVSSHHV